MDDLSLYRELRNENNRLQREVQGLKRGSGDGTLPPMEPVDAKIAAAEARTDTKFAELRGDLAKFATKGTVWGAVGTALGVVLAVAALAGNRFDAGMTIRSALDGALVDQRSRDQAQDRNFDAQGRKLDEILKRLPANGAEGSTDRGVR